MEPLQKAEPDPAYPKGKTFWIGIGLMVASFGVVGFYLVIPFLPVSTEVMASILVIAWIASWGLFFLGTLLTGKDGYLYLKKLIQSRFRKS